MRDDIDNIGFDARPTGKIRLRRITPTSSRLEYEWQGTYGKMWVEVPHVDFNGKPIEYAREEELPPNQ